MVKDAVGEVVGLADVRRAPLPCFTSFFCPAIIFFSGEMSFFLIGVGGPPPPDPPTFGSDVDADEDGGAVGPAPEEARPLLPLGGDDDGPARVGLLCVVALLQYVVRVCLAG